LPAAAFFACSGYDLLLVKTPFKDFHSLTRHGEKIERPWEKEGNGLKSQAARILQIVEALLRSLRTSLTIVDEPA
jgi:hypothetical protein